MAGEDEALTTLKNVEIFKVGNWRGNTSVEVTGAMLDQIVGNFHQLNAKVPGFGVAIKKGHSDGVGDPAYGWMSDLARVGDVLVADFNDVDPAIVDAVGKRRYNSVSIELYPKVKYDGKTFDNVLGGVALLGAEWPAVKGLKPLSSRFSDQAGKLVLSDQENVMKTFTEQEHADLMAAEVTKQIKEFSDKLTAAESRASIAEGALKSLKTESAKKDFTAVIVAAEAKGVVVPANKPAVQAMADAMLETKEGLSTFKSFIEGLPAQVKLGEEGKSKSTDTAVKAHDEVDARARKLMADGKAADYEKAVDAVFKADPDLKNLYVQEI